MSYNTVNLGLFWVPDLDVMQDHVHFQKSNSLYTSFLQVNFQHNSNTQVCATDFDFEWCLLAVFASLCMSFFCIKNNNNNTHTHRANNYLRCIQLNLWTSKLLDLMWSLLHWLTGACYDYKWMWMPKRPKRPKRHFNISPGWSNIYLAWTWVFSSHRYI